MVPSLSSYPPGSGSSPNADTLLAALAIFATARASAGILSQPHLAAVPAGSEVLRSFIDPHLSEAATAALGEDEAAAILVSASALRASRYL